MPPPPTAQELRTLTTTFAEGSYAEIQAQRFKDVVEFNWGFIPIFSWQLLGLFLFGMYAYRHKFFEPAPEALPAYRKWMIAGFVIGVVGNAATVAVRWIYDIPMTELTGTGALLALIQTIAVPALSLGYALAVILLVNSPVWQTRLSRFGAVGKTALSNYLLQSVIGTLIFYGYGLGLFGIGPALLLPLTVAIYVTQLLISRWWVARFQFGPAEWLWRSLTYLKMQPMARREGTQQPPVTEAAA